MQKNQYCAVPDDTVAALCTAPGGALSILRISGPDALKIVSGIWRGKHELDAPPRVMRLGRVCADSDDHAGEPCLAVYMKAPHSYTGEDTVELQCHGGSFAPKRLLDAVLKAGARPAPGGEFTRRAFLNGRMDLTQAEAVADLIGAKSEAAARLAERQMSGLLGSSVRAARANLLELLAEAESRLDFPDEELDWMPPERMMKMLEDTIEHLRKMVRTSKNGAVLRNGMRVVIAGRPNAGKSSLLNALLGYDRAIVTPIPGTTRDTLEEYASFRGIPVRLTDTAGLREFSDDPVEVMGIARTRASMHTAEFVFWVLDASSDDTARESLVHMNRNPYPGSNLIAVWNKIDLNPDPESLPEVKAVPTVRLSALTGRGLDALLDLFERQVWGGMERTETECEVSARHAELLNAALESLAQCRGELRNEFWELAASCLRSAAASLGGITGEDTPPDMLDEIFSRFCIGK